MHILRIVLNSGSVTELMFDQEDAMQDACEAFRVSAIAAAIPDDYGHECFIEPSQIAALIAVDLDAELKGQSIMTFERQMMQDRLTERVHKSRDLVSAPIIGRPANGSLQTIIRG
jgi:hypothetical protein